MKTAYTIEPKPDWVKRQEAHGLTVICNATRPLYGNAVNDTWELPFIHGRHYAALSPDDGYFADRMKNNERLDAVQLIFLDKERVIAAGKQWYEENCPDCIYLSDEDLMEQGLKLAESGDLLSCTDVR